MEKDREIIFHEQYFIDFYLGQPGKVQEKIEYVFKIIKTVQNVPEKFLKHIEGSEGLYEIRISTEGIISTAFSAVLIEEIWWFYLMPFRRKRKRPPRKN